MGSEHGAGALLAACTPKAGYSPETVCTASAHHLFHMTPHRERKYPVPICRMLALL